MTEFKFQSLKETEKWAREFAVKISRPSLILLDGEMGAGKTQLVKWFVAALGGAVASSPTFAIHQSYEAPRGALDHVDLYRLESAADLESTGFWDLLRAPDALVFVEWAERVAAPVWPNDIKKIRIEISKVGGDSEARLIRLG
jgi:tRNA threonylcarbamoyladenosine biosynthesis protein TsaE